MGWEVKACPTNDFVQHQSCAVCPPSKRIAKGELLWTHSQGPPRQRLLSPRSLHLSETAAEAHLHCFLATWWRQLRSMLGSADLHPEPWQKASAQIDYVHLAVAEAQV